MTTLTFKNTDIQFDSFVNAQGNLRYNILINGKKEMGFFLEDLSKESFIEDIIFTFRDSANRNSIFNKKEDCILFAKEIIELFITSEQDMKEKEEVAQIKAELIRFEKYVSEKTFVYVLIEFGKNKNNADYRQVSQEYTSNINILDASVKFEDFELSLEQMIGIIESEGFVKCTASKYAENRESLYQAI